MDLKVVMFFLFVVFFKNKGFNHDCIISKYLYETAVSDFDEALSSGGDDSLLLVEEDRKVYLYIAMKSVCEEDFYMPGNIL